MYLVMSASVERVSSVFAISGKAAPLASSSNAVIRVDLISGDELSNHMLHASFSLLRLLYSSVE